MKRTIAAILSAAMLVTAAAAAEAPSSWAKSAVDTARNAGIVPEQVDQAYTQSITRADFCALAAAVYRTWEKSGNVKSVDKAAVSFSDTKDEDVLLCASLGVVNGVGNGKFAPQQQLSSSAGGKHAAPSWQSAQECQGQREGTYAARFRGRRGHSGVGTQRCVLGVQQRRDERRQRQSFCTE